jgi:flagellar biosynthesis/type III secretory pathway protein FliH
METLMRSNYAYQSDLFRRLVSEGRQEGLEAGRQAGLEEGREEGREKGREEGWRAALRAGVVVVHEARGIVLTIDDHGRLGAEHDLVTLQRWLTQAATARSFAEAVRALG